MLANLLQEFAAPLSTEQANKIKDVLGELSLEQVNWLSGYLAGLAATGAAVGLKDVSDVVQGQSAALSQSAANLTQTAPNATQTAVERTATILYGSQTGNARGVAEQLHQQLQSQSIKAQLIDMADYNPKQLKKEQLLFVVVSTHGEGEPPDDAMELHEFINSSKAPKLSDLEFAVLALGDSSYEFFCQTGKDFDEALAKLGASRLIERVDCDVDYRNEASSWSEKVVSLIQEQSANELKDSPVDNKPQLSVISGNAAPNSRSAFDKFNPFAAEVVDVVPITARGSNKVTYHVELELEGSGLNYQPGDALGVWPENSSELVNETLALLKASGDVTVTVDGKERSLREALTFDYELTQVSPGFVKWLADHTQDHELLTIANEREKLNALLAESQVPDLLKAYSVDVEPNTLIVQLRRITPRLYSIASSQQEVDSEVHLTVGRVEHESDSAKRVGAASGYLSRLTSGDRAKVFVESNKHFKLPEDDSTPIIMIGAGTGIAPYRGFVQERAARGASGKNWLVFGNQHFAQDFLYQLEWQQFLKKEQLHKISLAFSRDQSEKVYVQHKLKEEAELIYQWIEEGAHLYLCGDKDRLARSVEQALVEIIAEQSGVNEEQAQNRLTELRKAGRFQKDVY